MPKVGLRRLRNRLGHYVRQALGLPNDPKVYRRRPRRLKAGELQRLIDEERGER